MLSSAEDRPTPRRSAPSARIQVLAQRFERDGKSPTAPQDEARRSIRRTSVDTARFSNGELASRPSTFRAVSLPQPPPSSVLRGALGQMNWERLPSPLHPLLQEAPLSEAAVRSTAPSHIEIRKEVSQLARSPPLQPSPPVPYPPSVRRVDAAPVPPMTNLSLEMHRVHKLKRVDGLPPISDDPLPDFTVVVPDSRATPLPLPDEPIRSKSPEEGSDDEGREIDGEESKDDLIASDEEPLIVGVGEGGKRKRRSSVWPAPGVQPVPAFDVFKRDAFPLHLPDLDAYLCDPDLFPMPTFSNAIELYTEEEAVLFGLARQSSSARTDLEVCGNQLSVSADSLNRDGLRKRVGRGAEEDATLEEGLLLTSDDKVQTQSMTAFSDTSVTLDQPKRDPTCSKPVRPAMSTGYPSSTWSQPTTRQCMFPPLMLLTEDSLDELKSNAVGPRKAPGGFLAAIPGVGSLLGTIVDFVVGVEGSTLAAGIFRLQLFIDFVQIMNLNLHFTTALHIFGDDVDGRWTANRVLLGVVPAIFSLDFVSIFGAAVIVLIAFTGVVAVLLLFFWRMTRMYNPNRTLEGFASQPWLFRLVSSESARHAKRTATPWRSSVWTKFANVSIVMLLTTLYIPLSKLAVDALVWSVDYWPAEARSTLLDSSAISPQGFCYTTTLDPAGFNWAYVILPIAILTVLFFTLWFPYRMMRTVRLLLPRVNEFNELGSRRTRDEMEAEYMRMLSHDASPLNFMYNAYRRRWGAYKPLYIVLFKLSNLLIVSIFTQQNCLFHKVDVKRMLVVQQAVLIGLQAALLVGHLYVQPFVDMLSNRSELVSRFGYVSTAVLGLLVALHVEAGTVYRSAVLYVVQALTYSGNLYFSLAGTAWMSHWIKVRQRRIDFSIDIFSPVLHVDKHVKRRIWQETLSAVLLSAPDYRMPVGQTVTFSIDDDWPPYLLQFRGTAAERHVENLKILKAIGMQRYVGTLDRLGEPGSAERWAEVIRRIQRDFAGPDAYWQPLLVGEQAHDKALLGVSSFFGKAFLVPFPPTLLIRYDQTEGDAARGTTASLLQLRTLNEMEAFVWQNESKAVLERRWVRIVLRALDGQPVHCSHVQAVSVTKPHGRLRTWLSGAGHRRKYELAKPVFYEQGVLTVQRRPAPTVDEYNFESGFRVLVTYTHGQRHDADGLTVVRTPLTIDGATAFGLRDDFAHSTSVARFIRENEARVSVRLPQMQELLHVYRTSFFREATEKRRTMTYAFLADVFDQPVDRLEDLCSAFRRSVGCCSAVRHLPDRYLATCTLLAERMAHVNRSRVHKWWYIFWDDLWRKNNGDYGALRQHRKTFNPQFPSSIAYTPLPRKRVEAILKSKKGVWSEEDVADRASESPRGKQSGLFNRGLLNRIYFLLDEMAFDRSLNRNEDAQPGVGRGVPLRVGAANSDGLVESRSMATVSVKSVRAQHSPTQQKDFYGVPMYADPFAQSSRHTGGGTDQDDVNIVERYAWPWTEQRLSGIPSQQRWKRVRGRVLEWLSLRPYKLHSDVEQMYIYLRTIDGRYEAPSSRLHLSHPGTHAY